MPLAILLVYITYDMQCQLLEHDIHPTYTGNTYLPPMFKPIPPCPKCGLEMQITCMRVENNQGPAILWCSGCKYGEEIKEPAPPKLIEVDPLESFWRSEQAHHEREQHMNSLHFAEC